MRCEARLTLKHVCLTSVRTPGNPLKYQKLVKVRDLENRNLIEHAILSGRDQLFETVFHVARLDIFDEEVW